MSFQSLPADSPTIKTAPLVWPTQHFSVNFGMDTSIPTPADPSSSLDRRLLLGAAGLAGVAALGSLTSRAGAGPLNPPAGAVAATGKTLTEVEPRIAVNSTNTPGDVDSLFKITQPGSYYLTGNITGVANKHGIKVAADNVTIDLNGFALIGVSLARDAIRGDGGPLLSGLSVRNGSITGWGNGSGIFAGNVARCRIEDVTILTVTFEGVWLGASAIIDRCTVKGARSGLRTGNTSVIRNSIVEVASESAFYCGDDCAIVDCIAKSGEQNAFTATLRATIDRCQASLSGIGINVGNYALVRNCSIDSTTFGPGIVGGLHSTVSGCSVKSTGDSGILMQNGALVERCAVRGANSYGISVASDSLVEGCMAHAGQSQGIIVGSSSSVTGCISTANSNEGIRASSGCRVSDNNCAGNGVAGVRVAGTRCTVSGNVCTTNFTGIRVESNGNVIIRNTCSGNTTNWVIVANNAVGPILDRTAPASAAISGNSAASSLATTDPNANFTH